MSGRRPPQAMSKLFIDSELPVTCSSFWRGESPKACYAMINLDCSTTISPCGKKIIDLPLIKINLSVKNKSTLAIGIQVFKGGPRQHRVSHWETCQWKKHLAKPPNTVEPLEYALLRLWVIEGFGLWELQIFIFKFVQPSSRPSTTSMRQNNFFEMRKFPKYFGNSLFDSEWTQRKSSILISPCHGVSLIYFLVLSHVTVFPRVFPVTWKRRMCLELVRDQRQGRASRFTNHDGLETPNTAVTRGA